MKKWFQDECEKRRPDNYTLASINWDGKSPAMNIVIFDRQESHNLWQRERGSENGLNEVRLNEVPSE